MTVGRYLGMVAGLGVTAASMSSGFIWAAQGNVLLVYVSGFFAWTGYISAHYAVTGVFVDDMDGTESGTKMVASDPTDGGLVALLSAGDWRNTLGFLLGIVVLVTGIAILAWFVRQENHLLGNLGSGLFLAGYVVAHYFDAGKPL